VTPSPPHTLHPPLTPVLPCCTLQVLLLDEITVDLDVLGRADLMRFLVEECDSRGATIIYATHIFDGLEFWPSHVAYVARGTAQRHTQALPCAPHPTSTSVPTGYLSRPSIMSLLLTGIKQLIKPTLPQAYLIIGVCQSALQSYAQPNHSQCR
jgi:energy-coupling factor transporter ATP-binding protein EcfA2